MVISGNFGIATPATENYINTLTSANIDTVIWIPCGLYFRFWNGHPLQHASKLKLNEKKNKLELENRIRIHQEKSLLFKRK
ncbi:hypothetical protein T07_13000 [Trichinella nelsoni]|uniref:Uncharacterized protein n=1 Tax=Trichinella nelsoni TaxID=6336 RepID=A0A0V0RLM8_9BILA|nr:hypothetical protein T07_13000 [Trichinella nelsoni]